MADTPPAKPPAGKDSGGQFGFLGRKVFGIPIWVIALVAVGIYYWYTHYGPGAQQATTTTPTGQQQGKKQRPRIIVVRGGGGGGRRDHDRKGKRGPGRAASPDQQATQAAAPMTAGGIYGPGQTATMDGTVYPTAAPAGYVPGEYAPPPPENTYVPAG